MDRGYIYIFSEGTSQGKEIIQIRGNKFYGIVEIYDQTKKYLS